MWTKIVLIFKRLSPLMIEYLLSVGAFAVQQILPVALEIVLDLMAQKMTGAQKKQIAFDKIRLVAPAVGTAIINDAIEKAVIIAKARNCTDGTCE